MCGIRRAAIDVGAVPFVLLDDAEHAHGRRMAAHAGRDRRFREQAVGVEYPQGLSLDRDGDHQRADRLGVFLDLFLKFGAKALQLFLALLRLRRRRFDLPHDHWVFVGPEHRRIGRRRHGHAGHGDECDPQEAAGKNRAAQKAALVR